MLQLFLNSPHLCSCFVCNSVTGPMFCLLVCNRSQIIYFKNRYMLHIASGVYRKHPVCKLQGTLCIVYFYYPDSPC